MDTTPRSGNPEPDRPDGAPRWVLVLVISLIVLGVLWVMISSFKSGY
jgi:hypothetical protein